MQGDMMMIKTSKAAATILIQPEKGQECCMCGDFGLSSELFRCKVCQFRSQHRYCSNQFPKSEDYSVCNWCLSGEIKDNHDQFGDKTQQKYCINSSSSNKSNANTSGNEDQEDEEEEYDHRKTITKKKNSHTIIKKNKITSSTTTTVKNKLHDIKNSTIKKQTRSQHLPERLPVLAAARKRITTTTRRGDDHTMDDDQKKLIRRTKSEEISNGRINTNAGRLIKKPVFRNKVRRYKLLDEVSAL